MLDAFICDALRTPIGRYGGGLANVRTDDLGAVPIRALIERNTKVDWSAIDDVVYDDGEIGLLSRLGRLRTSVAAAAAASCG